MMVMSGATIISLESSCWFGTDCDAEAGTGGKALVGAGLVVTIGAIAGLAVSVKRPFAWPTRTSGCGKTSARATRTAKESLLVEALRRRLS